MTEQEYQRRIIDTARAYKWRCVHIRAAEVAKGRWMPPYEGDTGLPDLILAKGGRVLLVELKSDRGKTTPAQDAWLAAAGDCGRLWRPADWPEALATLSGAAVVSARYTT